MYLPYIHFTFCLHWSDSSHPPRNVDQKACFFSSNKVVKHSTFVTCLTGSLHQSIMFTGDSQCCQCIKVILLFLKSTNCFGDICFLCFMTINILTSQSYEGIPPSCFTVLYRLIYLVYLNIICLGQVG